MTSLRVGNLPFRATAEDLQPLFEKYGDVGDVYIPLERGSGRSRGFAFVRYYDKRDAESFGGVRSTEQGPEQSDSVSLRLRLHALWVE